jgi:hypothetical protein
VIYAKVDVELRDHERAHLAGVAMATWTWALLYARSQQTDGLVPHVALRGAWVGEREARRHAAKLVEVGLWEACDGGWRICRYAEKNDTRAVIDENRARSRERMHRVRANKQRTNGEPHGPEQPAVPGSGSGSGSGSGLSRDPDLPDRSLMRARAAPDPAAAPPDWWEGVLATVAQNAEPLPAGEAWLRYAGHRAGKRYPATREDALYWLTTVMVPEARDRRDVARRRDDREAKWDRQKAGPGTLTDPTKPTPEQEAAAVQAWRDAMAKRRKGAA